MRNACLINFTNLWRRNEMKRWRNIPKFRQDSHHSAKSKDGRNLRALEHVCIGPIHWHPLLALFARRKLGSISGCRSPIGNTLILRNSKFSSSIWFLVGKFSIKSTTLCWWGDSTTYGTSDSLSSIFQVLPHLPKWFSEFWFDTPAGFDTLVVLLKARYDF